MRMFRGLPFVYACAAIVVSATGAQASPAGDAAKLGAILARYSHAIADPGAPKIATYEAIGTVSGAGLSGAYHEWATNDSHRSDANLGPRVARTLQIGDRFYLLDENGIERELLGVLLRRSKTQAWIDSGDFATARNCCVLRESTTIEGAPVDVIDVTADGGDTETLALSSDTGLPRRLTFDDDDARTSIDFSDWRTVAGHRFAFKSVTSDGDKAFDSTQLTTTVTVDQPIDKTVFAVPPGRRIEMTGSQTIPLTFRDGHYYVSAKINGRPYTFLLDTGAQNIVLDQHVAEELHLPAFGDLEASGAKRTGGLHIVVLDDFEVGLGKLRHIVATAIDLHGSTAGAFSIDGILGYPFFASALVKIDPAGRTMTFGPPGSFAPEGERLDVDVDRAIPEASLRVNGSMDAPFIIDTGNAADVLLYKPFVDRHGGVVPFSSNMRNSYGIGGITASYRSTLDELGFGSIPIYHIDTDVMQSTRGAFADRFDAGNVGLGVLKNFVLTFDLPDHALYVARSTSFDDGSTRN